MKSCELSADVNAMRTVFVWQKSVLTPSSLNNQLNKTELSYFAITCCEIITFILSKYMHIVSSETWLGKRRLAAEDIIFGQQNLKC